MILLQVTSKETKQTFHVNSEQLLYIRESVLGGSVLQLRDNCWLEVEESPNDLLKCL